MPRFDHFASSVRRVGVLTGLIQRSLNPKKCAMSLIQKNSSRCLPMQRRQGNCEVEREAPRHEFLLAFAESEVPSSVGDLCASVGVTKPP